MHNPTYSGIQEFVNGSGYLIEWLSQAEINQAQSKIDNGQDFDSVIDELYEIADMYSEQGI